MAPVGKKLRTQLTRLYLGLAIPLLVIVVVVNLLGFRMLLTQQKQIRGAGLERYAQQLGNELQSIQNHLITFCTSETDINNMQYLNDITERVLASKRLIDRMNNDVALYSDVQVEFLYSSYLKTSLIARKNPGNYAQTQRENQLVQAISQAIEEDTLAFLPGVWQVCQQDGVAYLLYFYSSGDASAGMLLEVADLLRLPQSLEPSQGVALLQGGEVVAQVGEEGPEEWIWAKIGSTGLTLQMSAAVTGTQLQHAWTALFCLLVVGVVVTLAAMYYFTATRMVKPIHRMVQVMRQVGRGDMTARVDTEGMLEELASIGETMNDMLDQIQTLQRNEQEALRQEEKSRLRNLQLQINPHFLGNCLNMLNNAALCGDVGQVFAMTNHLSGYFRSMRQMEEDFIPLGKELEFVQDFLEIQTLRFPGEFAYEICAPVFLHQIPVPPSVIKSFAENAIQFCRSGEQELLLSIDVGLCDQGQPPRLEISIRDNGPGFRREVLEQLQTQDVPFFDGRTHIGIANVRKRLQILYGEAGKLEIGNRPEGGACIYIWIPLQ